MVWGWGGATEIFMKLYIFATQGVWVYVIQIFKTEKKYWKNEKVDFFEN